MVDGGEQAHHEVVLDDVLLELGDRAQRGDRLGDVLLVVLRLLVDHQVHRLLEEVLLQQLYVRALVHRQVRHQHHQVLYDPRVVAQYEVLVHYRDLRFLEDFGMGGVVEREVGQGEGCVLVDGVFVLVVVVEQVDDGVDEPA